MVANRLWIKSSTYLRGNKEGVRVDNDYIVPFETGFLLVLFGFSRPRRIQPDMERFFCMNRSHISAAVNTFTKALCRVAFPHLSNPSIFHGRMPYYAYLVKKKTGFLVDNVWGFIEGIPHLLFCKLHIFVEATFQSVDIAATT